MRPKDSVCFWRLMKAVFHPMLRDDICRVVLRYLDADASQMEVCIRRPESRCAGAENSAGDLPVLCTVIPVRSFRLKGIC